VRTSASGTRLNTRKKPRRPGAWEGFGAGWWRIGCDPRTR